jgi:diaminopimelate epimerase
MSREIQFVKMQGAGNDFVMIDNRDLRYSNSDLSELAPLLCDRKFGVGGDGIIALQPDPEDPSSLVMAYKNPDGSDAGMCGNGARCFARFAVSFGYPDTFKFRVHGKTYKAEVNGETVNIHFPLETTVEKKTVDDAEVYSVYTNTEHIVCPVSAPGELENEDQLIKLGRELRNHDAFNPPGTNVNFISGVGSENLQLQTYERGVENLTLACGTGAIASALGWHHLQDAGAGDFLYGVHVKGGTLRIRFSFELSVNQYSNIQLEGPARFVFNGTFTA